MPGVYERKLDLDFSGGLNITDPPTKIKDSELVTCENFWYPDGFLCKRPGFLKVHNTPLAVSDLVILKNNPLNNNYIISTLDGTALNGVSLAGTVTPITGTGADTAKWMLTINGANYLGFDGPMGIRTLIGFAVGAATITNSPQSQVAAWHKSRIFADVLGTPGRIAFSDPNAPGTWQVASTVDIGVEDYEAITALISLGDLLLIFKYNSVWALYVQGDSPANWVARKINASLGCAPGAGNGATYSYNGEVYFISKKGLFKTNGSSFINLSEKIWVTEDLKYQFSVFNYGMYRVTRWNDSLIVIGRSTVDPVGYTHVYNLVTGAWSTWTFLGSSLGFDDILVGYVGVTSAQAVVARTTSIYTSSDANIFNYDSELASGRNTYADGFLINTVGTGAAYTSTFQTKEFTAGVDELLRSKYMGLEYVARASPTFKTVLDGVVGAAQTPGFHATLRKGYKISGGGRGRTLALQGTHALTSPYEFYRGALHLTSKVPILASGAP